MRRRLVLLGLAGFAVLGVGVGLPLCGGSGEAALEKCSNGAPERSEASVSGWSWWPLGTKCTLVEADGTHRQKVVPPWRGGAWEPED